MSDEKLLPLNDIYYRLSEIIDCMKAHQKALDGRIDGRALAIAITELETGRLWLDHSSGF